MIDKTGIRAFRNSYFDSASQSYRVYQYSVFSALDTLTQVERADLAQSAHGGGTGFAWNQWKLLSEDMQPHDGHRGRPAGGHGGSVQQRIWRRWSAGRWPSAAGRSTTSR